MADKAKDVKAAPVKKAETKTEPKKTAEKKPAAKKTAEKKPTSVKKGDMVLVQVSPLQNNGDPEAFGFVTAVDDMGTPTMVGVKVMLDGDESLTLRNVAYLTKAEAKKDDAPRQYAVAL